MELLLRNSDGETGTEKQKCVYSEWLQDVGRRNISIVTILDKNGNNNNKRGISSIIN
jgi:hypothetical protein